MPVCYFVGAGDEDDLVSIDSRDDAERPVEVNHVVMGTGRNRGEPPSYVFTAVLLPCTSASYHCHAVCVL